GRRHRPLIASPSMVRVLRRIKVPGSYVPRPLSDLRTTRGDKSKAGVSDGNGTGQQRVNKPAPDGPSSPEHYSAHLSRLGSSPQPPRGADVHFLIPRSQVRSLPGPFTAERWQHSRMVRPGGSCDVRRGCDGVLSQVLSSAGAVSFSTRGALSLDRPFFCGVVVVRGDFVGVGVLWR